MNDIHNTELPKGPRFGARYVQLILLVGLCALEANVRVILPITLDDMLNSTSSSDNDTQQEWSTWKSKQTILSSFDWGYIILPIVGGKLSTIFDAKWCLAITVLVNSIATVLMPLLGYCFETAGIELGIKVFRVFQGLCAGLYSTICYHILAFWTPPNEVSTTVAMLNSGYSLGYLITMKHSSNVEWDALYYLSGFMGILWIIPWIIFASKCPTEHKTITIEEKLYIQASLASREQPKKIPWKAIFTSLPMAAIIISVTGKGAMDSLMLNEIIMHMRIVMNQKENEEFQLALSYALRTVMIILGGIISDWLVNRHFLSRTVARKLFNTIGTIIPAIALLLAGFCDQDQTDKYFVSLLIVVVASAATYDGCMLNIMDISPTYCGTLRGITSFFFTLFSLLLPLAASNIISEVEKKDEWRILFVQVSGINIFAGTFYIFFASGKIQRWLPVTKKRIYGSIWGIGGKVVNESNL